MASYSSNFSSWADFEAKLSAAQAFESSPTGINLENSINSLKNTLLSSPYSSSGTSTHMTLYYSGGVTAVGDGTGFGTSSAVVSHIQVTNGSVWLDFVGSVAGANPSTGIITSYTANGYGYQESGGGRWPMDGSAATFNHWESTVPTTLGVINFWSSGSKTVSGNGAVTTTFNSTTVSDSAALAVSWA